ncbi:hypothetical protein F5883DRAFT_578678 [Diaporthe sp. PMI_573]|jgi:hypothetical protein|nr:hypothetical protein F5883DRAFT_578678 [Diaporthaceae sp. PMI_573]
MLIPVNHIIVQEIQPLFQFQDLSPSHFIMPNAERFGLEIDGDWIGDKVISTSNSTTATIDLPAGKDSSRTDASNDVGPVGSKSPTQSSIYTPNPEPPWDPAIGVSRAPDASQRQVRSHGYATPEGWEQYRDNIIELYKKSADVDWRCAL